MTQEIIQELRWTATELLDVLASFTQEQLNSVPFAGSWTAAQVGQHLLQSYTATDVLAGTVQATERAPDHYCGGLKAQFLNFDNKMTSPDFVVPAAGVYDKEALVQSLSDKLAHIQKLAGTLDLSQTCLDFALPGAENFTRLEWLCFILYHTQRHIHQLKNIHRIVTTNNNYD